MDKPQGWTSFDVVNKTRNLIANQLNVPKKSLKVGHTGTLDPLATGLLILTVGSYCKRAQEFIKQDKSYECEIILGINSTTDDEEGELTEISSRQPTKKEVNITLKSFIGEQSQVPPQFSAIKVDGKRAYDQARKGQKVELKSRIIKVNSISEINYDYPRVSCVLDVSSGTYIRSIARDLGNKLNTGAYLSQLRRTSIGEYSVNNAVTMDELMDLEIEFHLLQA